VFNFWTDQLAYIRITRDLAQFISALAWIKHSWGTDYARSHNRMSDIINYVRSEYDLATDATDYSLAMQRLQAQLGRPQWIGSPFSWIYFMQCRKYDRDPACLDNLRDFVRNAVIELAEALIQIENSPYYAAGRQHLSTCAGIITQIDYRDLFFRLEIPSAGRLSQLDRSAVADYSRRNLDIMRQAVEIMPHDLAEQMLAVIEDLSNDLNSA
jgi:hypothetical protein